MKSVVGFVVGNRYTRKDIFRMLDIVPEPTGGNWFTGYTRYEGEHYVFVNVNTVGRTGHDYGDRWLEDGTLLWHGKTRSHINQPVIREMISSSVKVHFFLRYDSNDVEFEYYGIGKAISVNLKTPVEVIWQLTRA